MGRPINQINREQAILSVDEAIDCLIAERRPITRAAIAAYIGVAPAYLAKHDKNGNKNYLGQYVDARLAEDNNDDSPDIRSLHQHVHELEKTLRKKDRAIKILADRNTTLAAECSKLEDQCNKYKITLNTLYAEYYDGEKEEMRKSRIS